MTNNVLDGKSFANQIKAEIKAEIQQMATPPGLAVVLVGHDPSSEIYVGHKQRACETVGIQSHRHQLPEDTTEAALLALIDQLNHDANIHGILVQLPLPTQINQDTIVDAIHPSKDVDGFHAYNLGRLAQRNPALRPCTPYGIIKLLQHYDIAIEGKHAVIVGASNIVGRPMALEFLLLGATISVCHRFTPDLQPHVALADILVVATGKPDLIDNAWVKPDCIVVDVGIHRDQNNRIHGDVDFEGLQDKVAWITPVPGGVGPMTVAMLLHNTLVAAKLTR